MSSPDINLFRDEEFEEVKLTPEKVVCLGMEFESDEARRAYFREELRKKLPELRQIEGFPIGEDEDIINLSDPPYYTACPNPWLNDFVAEWEKEKVELEKQGKRSAEFKVNEPYASDVSEGKNNPMYMLHTYHTKVPHPAIMRYILHYTQPGDIVFDGFCGTGMTGVAANACSKYDTNVAKDVKNAIWGQRHAMVSDLSPAASFISSVLNSNFDLQKIKASFLKKLENIKREYSWMYETESDSGEKVKVNFIVWSEKVLCPQCFNHFPLWSVNADTINGRMKDKFNCPKCGTLLTKDKCESYIQSEVDFATKLVEDTRTYEEVLINYTFKGHRYFKTPNSFDKELVDKINAYEIKHWFPTEKIMFKGSNWGDTWRSGVHKGTTRVHHFYTKRNLIFISALWAILDNQERFIATSIISRNLTKLNRYVLKPRTPHGEVNGPLSGTLYLSSEFVEQNAFDLIESKLPSFGWNNKGIITSINAAQSIPIEENSVDYIFTDPPFGDNLMYSELNFLWESWLKVATNNSKEAIQNASQDKGVFEYNKLMTDSFCEYYRILKPGKWMTVEFSNTRASIWNAIQSALKNAGFIIVNVAALDKKHGGIKSMTYTTAVKQDLVITCYKPTDELINKFEQSIDKSVNAMDFIEELLYHLPVHLEKNNSTTAVIERSPKILYDRLISYYVQHGYAIPMDAQEFQKALRERFIERDGMFFTASQTVEYEAKKEKTDGIVPMALFISSEAEGIEWLKRELKNPQTYQEILPNWMKDMVAPKKGDVLPELATILEENFIKDEDGKWRKPDAEKAADLELLRGKKLMKEFNLYLEQASKPKAKRMKDTRLEVLRYGFKECYKQKNYQAIVTVGDHIQESLLQEDEVLLQYYDIASMRV